MERRRENSSNFSRIESRHKLLFNRKATRLGGSRYVGRAQEGNAGPHPKFSLGQICGKFAKVFNGKTPKFVVVHRKTDFFVSLATRDVPWRFVECVSFA
jgi:hypothetical protein